MCGKSNTEKERDREREINTEERDRVIQRERGINTEREKVKLERIIHIVKREKRP